PGLSGKDLAGRVAMQYQDKVWQLSGTYTVIQQNYHNEMGFTPRVGIRRFASISSYTWRPQNGTALFAIFALIGKSTTSLIQAAVYRPGTSTTICRLTFRMARKSRWERIRRSNISRSHSTFPARRSRPVNTNLMTISFSGI